MTNNNNKTIFISYWSKEKKIAEKIEKILIKNKLNVSIDYRFIELGDNIENTIEKKIIDSSHLISLISRKTLYSSWVMWEIFRAYTHFKNIGTPESIKFIKIRKFNITSEKLIEDIKSKFKKDLQYIKKKIISFINEDEPNIELLDKQRKRLIEGKTFINTIFQLFQTHLYENMAKNKEDSIVKLLKSLRDDKK